MGGSSATNLTELLSGPMPPFRHQKIQPIPLDLSSSGKCVNVVSDLKDIRFGLMLPEKCPTLTAFGVDTIGGFLAVGVVLWMVTRTAAIARELWRSFTSDISWSSGRRRSPRDVARYARLTELLEDI